MKTRVYVVGLFLTNCYVLSCQQTREAIVIDPGFDDQREAGKILNSIEQNELKLKFLVSTHGHPDHICGNGIVKKKYGTPMLIHRNDEYT
jgi:glyoxylase-like metal-dependent hydrolase (beta-lactamase superfamily II)